MPADERAELTRGLEYPEDSAGRRMQTDFVAVPPEWTVGQTIDHAREDADLPVDFYAIFVVDEDKRFVGAVPLDKLLRSQRPVKIADIMVARLARDPGNRPTRKKPRARSSATISYRRPWSIMTASLSAC